MQPVIRFSYRRRYLLGFLIFLPVVAFLLFYAWKSNAIYYSTFLVGDPHDGAHVFREKGCGQCHAVNQAGTGTAPDLGFRQEARGTLHQLVTEMWNHAPEMWKQMDEHQISYPSFSPHEMADLFAYLYTARYLDEPGDATKGWLLFTQKGCIQCHSTQEGGGAPIPDLKSLPPVVTPIFWAQTMWNHAPVMEAHMQQKKLSWPKFSNGEMNDLLAFVKRARAGEQREAELLPADPRRGRRLFREKACVECHTAEDEGGDTGPNFNAEQTRASTLTEMAGQMWNHSPEMWQAMKAKGIERPVFEGQEMADLIAYLYSVRYFELGGNPDTGRQRFAERSCARCHGEEATGGEHGPNLRGGSVPVTPVTLARALWHHGPRIYQRTQELGMDWPTLEENDLGHLMAFLNAPPAE